MRKGIDDLLKKPKLSVVQAINDLDVLIVEVSAAQFFEANILNVDLGTHR
jgi:hypothetical protein